MATTSPVAAARPAARRRSNSSCCPAGLLADRAEAGPAVGERHALSADHPEEIGQLLLEALIGRRLPPFELLAQDDLRKELHAACALPARPVLRDQEREHRRIVGADHPTGAVR